MLASDMTSTRKIIRAFLASPGDLQDERKAIRNVVDEFNEILADKLGYQVELMGWEDTVARFGRPQHIINQELDRCDLFIGMIWKRWGTPPDNSGDFSSGFQEEFARSVARREGTGSPEISLFLKDIPDDFMLDPGDDLKKVLEFRDTVTADKKVFYQNFSTVRDIEGLARKCITDHVFNIRAEDESSELDERQTKRARSGSEEEDKEGMSRGSSPLSAEGFEFLEGLVERIKQPSSMDNLTASDVARFRLLSNLITKSGNEEINLGVHDINILFTARTKGMKLGDREMRVLARLGFQHFANENVPLWCWYSALADSHFNPAVVSSVLGDNENEKVGAISVLTALEFELPTDERLFNRDWIIGIWFSDDSPTKVRTSALEYLAKCGTAKDLEIAQKEYDKNDHSTSRSALECMIGILLRTGQTKAAQKLVLESQVESLNDGLLGSVLEGFESIETSELLLGLEHRNLKVRLQAIKTLLGRGELSIEMSERLSEDSDALVRNEAVAALLKLGKQLRNEEVKKILVTPKKKPNYGALLAGGLDSVGDSLFQQYQLSELKKLSEAELEKKVGEELIYEDAPYFALMEKYYRNHVDELRRDVDDRFGAYFEERIRRTEAKFSGAPDIQDIVKKTRGAEEYLRKKLTRQGLNVLCAAMKPNDLQRIRANLRVGYTGASKHDAEYIGNHGEWSDILLLANAQAPMLGDTLLTTRVDKEYQVGVAKAITSIGKKHSVSDLLSLEMPAAILKKTIELCAESRFASISREALSALFNNESDEVRKAAAVMAVRALPARRIKMILREYVISDNTHYYNVIHWLDLGASMRRQDARKLVRELNSH